MHTLPTRDNPEAWITGSKRKLFASPAHGGDLPTALEYLDRALALDPDNERALVYRGIAHDKLGHADKARADLDRALEVNPSSRIAEIRRLEFQDVEWIEDSP